MTQRKDVISDNNSPEPKAVSGIRMSITTKLVLSFLAVIIVSGVIFTVVGIFLISNHIENDAKKQAAHDLASAQDVYLNRLNQLEEVVARTASNNRLQDAITAQNMEQVVDELLDIHFREGLDILTVTSSDGTVLLRASDVDATGDNIGDENQIKQVLTSQDPFVSTATISNDELRRESGILADKVAAANANIRQTIDPYGDVMLISASAPIFSVGHSLIGAVWAGSILGADSSLICEISQSVFGGEQYEGKQIGFVTIYQGDTAILACPDQGDSAELIGTLLSTEEYDQVVALGEPWFGEDTVSDNTYITAYEPIRSSNGEIVGIMQIGELKQIYLDIRNQFIIAFLAVTVVGALIAMLFAYYIAQRISGPIKQLVAASSN
ncbi:MAG: cache domain-containing protein, partial [Candidatus Promineifilaceae bacterium]